MSQVRNIVGAALGVVWLFWGEPLVAEARARADEAARGKKPEATRFLRLRRDADEQPVSLETATVRYVRADGKRDGKAGPVIDLVGVVHIGEKGYYETLNRLLAEYDVVLYELVAPEGTRVPRGGKKSDNPVSLLQGTMKRMLALESQTEHIDYQADNFVHADLSPEKLAEAMQARGHSGLSLALSVISDLFKQAKRMEAKQKERIKPGKPEPELDLLSLLTDPNASLKLKRMMAEQFDTAEIDGSLGPTLGGLLIEDRNKAALKVLDKELAKGKKKIAVFYGAGHMPDLERRLLEDYGMKKDKQDWLRAWDLRGRKDSPSRN